MSPAPDPPSTASSGEAALAQSLLAAAAGAQHPETAGILAVLEAVVRQTALAGAGTAGAGTVRQQGRSWQMDLWTGADPAEGVPKGDSAADRPAVPETLVAEALDHRQAQHRQPWWAWPIPLASGAEISPALRAQLPQALVLWAPDGAASTAAPQAIEPQTIEPQTIDTAALEACGRAAAATLGGFCPLLRRLSDLSERAERLERLLDFAAHWHREDDPEALLRAIAGAATELLRCERASIFLWDRRRKKLVGKPALGVGHQPLEVDDAAGIVGAVLQSGQPRRWQASEDEESEVNRAVDRQLQFTTRSLLAVPLEDQKGKPLGVFEVINKSTGRFSTEDIDTLTRLATQAAGVIRNTQDRHTAIRSRDRLVADVAETVQVIGHSDSITALRKTVSRVAATDLALLVLGENGTGKEVLARSVHFQSPRRSEPFVAVNCAALVESLLESELFGHEKGAFTDAHQSRPGKFELASGGTLFLDEIGDLSPGGQAKLLRVLEEKVIVRVGGSASIPVDVRVVAATNRSLAEMVREKTFREDLYFRLNVVSLQLPPLRERGDDILLLANHFLEHFAQQIGRLPPKISREAAAAMRRHRWPGNVRELRNLMERVSYLCPDDTVAAADLAFSADPKGPGESGRDPALAMDVGLTEATRQFQIQAIEQAIARCQGNMTEAAATLGLHRSNLYRKLKQLGMDEPK
ncbi:sigma-54-dependent Fis family transcriptional regulator [Roseimaritima sediminicola]|uniref:sigma-54-dependent Fis family transcriptional regulator n=1 Tax=Roseimaritima sediminicola TaxID=2662066 RepID=UPI001F464033|nr:sigma-54-dependent Fis family transcriptional regulator [Roseimaritima sediminicola]